MRVLGSRSAEETYNIAKDMGEAAKEGEVVTLTGDLGTGKTVFAKGFAAGLGVKEHVSSPTYTIVQQYDDGRLPLYHFDVYRIGDISEMDETGYDDCISGDGVTLIEWAEMIEDIIPERAVRVKIEKEPSRGNDYRRIEIEE
ncbi:MAG: tRNA (adenosine(37)-N6)-threonylcarbamoyltransferase complex ATPase subunit type 1 TsaE [Lachnospiraceae bacterium]|nr:tRNA (adenosine(37)-N6)-threonylcarbamoyltransferase complex ATPase subunit type 1 TsaE [Lachnospiraceae bacterium]